MQNWFPGGNLIMVLIKQPLIINGAQIKRRAKLFRSKHYVLEGGLGIGIIGMFVF